MSNWCIHLFVISRMTRWWSYDVSGLVSDIIKLLPTVTQNLDQTGKTFQFSSVCSHIPFTVTSSQATFCAKTTGAY